MKQLVTLLLFFISFTINSQVYVGIRDYYGEKTKPNNPKVFEKLKGSKILFVLPDIYTKEEYNLILKDAWKFSEYELVSIKEFRDNPSKYLTVSAVIAEYKGIITTVNYTNPNKLVKQNEYVFSYIDFYIVDNIKVVKKETTYVKTYFGEISFCPDYAKLRNDGYYSYSDLTPGYFRNLKLGYLKNYFSLMSKNLSENKLYDGYANFVNKQLLTKLKTQKLYITEDVKEKNMGVFNRNDRDLNTLTEDYKFEKEFISIDELNKKIIAGEEFYYLFHNQDNSKKIISIVNSKTGEVIFNSLERMSYLMKEKDFKDLNKAISKS